MYCSQCGNQLDENGYCQTCNRYATELFHQNKTFTPKPLRTCAWFAPVAVILCFIFSVLISQSLISFLVYNWFESNLVPGTSDSVWYSVISAVLYLIPMIIVFALSTIALSNQPTTIKKIATVSFAIPILTISFMNTILSNVLPYIATYASQEFGFFSEGILYTYSLFSAIASIIAYLISAVLSYVLTKTYFEIIEKYISKKTQLNKSSSENSNNSSTEQNPNVVNFSSTAYYSTKSKAVAALLCFFFGYLGIHRFYTGKIGTGILWLLTVGLFGFGTFIDFFIIIFGGFKDSEDRPLR